MTTQEFVIEVRELCKSFKLPASSWLALGNVARSMMLKERKLPKSKKAVDNVSFSVPQGEIFGLLGRNGSGKSSVIRILTTLLTPDRGTVRVLGHDISKDPQVVQKQIARVSVDPAFWRVLSVDENLRYHAMLYALNVQETMALAAKLLASFGLKPDDRYKQIKTMSRGEQQKVAIARALLPGPKVLFLDEPTTGLDPVSRRAVHAQIRELNSQGVTILLTTHDMAEAENLCHRIAIMSEGTITALGTSQELKRMRGIHATLEDAFVAITGTSLDEWKEAA